MSVLNQAEVYPVSRPLLWIPICALAALYGMFTLGWMVYRVHLPAQMTQLGFSAQAAPTLLLVEAILTIAVEPLAGAMSDRSQRQQHTRWPLIAWGVGLSSLLFVLWALQVAFVGPRPGLRWIMVALLLVWSVAMSLFRSPALALIRDYAPTARLPQAASLLTVAFGLAGAATPLASPAVLGLGPTLSFMLAAILIVLSALWLRSSQPETQISAQTSRQPVSLGHLARIFGLGLTATLAFRLAIETFPKLLKAQVPAVSPPLFVGLVFLTLAVTALPVGKLALRQGNSRIMLVGIVAAALYLALMPLGHQVAGGAVIAIGLGVGFSLILNGIIPFALVQMPVAQAGLSIGLLFAGAAVATSLMLGVLGKPGALSPAAAIGLAIAALIGAGCCVGLNNQR